MNTTPEPRLTPDLVVDAVLHGLLDEDLERIASVVATRRKVIASTAAARLKPGDKFHLQNISPKYLAGALVEYVGKEGDWLKCKMVSYASAKYPAGKTVLLRTSHVGQML